MAQNLIGGATNYRIQSAQDILDDIEKWIYLTKKTEKFIIEQHNELKSNGYWNKIPYNFQSTVESSIFYLKTIGFDLSLIRNTIESDNVTEREISLLNSIGDNAIKYNIDYGRTFHEDLHIWSEYNNPNFKKTEDIYCNARDYFVALQDAKNASIRLENYMKKANIINNNISIGNNVKGIQLQQGTINSIQEYTDNSINQTQALDILHEIYGLLEKDKIINDNKYTKQIEKIVLETIEMLEKKEKDSKIKNAFDRIKKLASNLMDSIILEQIMSLITQLF